MLLILLTFKWFPFNFRLPIFFKRCSKLTNNAGRQRHLLSFGEDKVIAILRTYFSILADFINVVLCMLKIHPHANNGYTWVYIWRVVRKNLVFRAGVRQKERVTQKYSLTVL